MSTVQFNINSLLSYWTSFEAEIRDYIKTLIAGVSFQKIFFFPRVIIIMFLQDILVF